MNSRFTRWIARRLALALLGVFTPIASAAAQDPPAQPPAATMTLEEAISLARRNNPAFRAQANDESVADWQVREAYGAFLPGLSLSNRFSYQAPGTAQGFGAFTAEDLGLGRTPATYTSSYSIGLGMQLSGATFFGTKTARANQRATEARIDAAAYTLMTDVTRQYLAGLRARDGVRIAQSALESTDQALKLAEARLAVGEATRLDVAQAEVDYGRAEVGLLQAQSLFQTEKLRLMQQIGVTIDRDVELTSSFNVFEPTFTLEDLEAQALASHPQVVSMRADEAAAKASSRSAAMQYLPSIFINGGWNGFVRRSGTSESQLETARESAQNRVENCEFNNFIMGSLTRPVPGFPENCSRHLLTAEQEARVLSRNDEFPFHYAANPASVGVTVSIPIWDGFTRERQLQTARVAADDAKHRLRGEELSRRTLVATSLLGLQTAYRTVGIEERNAARAGESLELARERYRLGAGSILELTQAQEQKVRADQAHLAAVYTFHETLAALEAAVGRPLR
jgi:outer membrane protein